jgi:hypothetical protein
VVSREGVVDISGTSSGISSISDLESKMDDLRLDTLEAVLDNGCGVVVVVPGVHEDGLSTVGPEVSNDGVLGEGRRETVEVTAELGLKKDVPKEVSGG